MSMMAIIFSDDQPLFEFCRAILADYKAIQLIQAKPEVPLQEAQIYIWDYCPGMNIALEIASANPSRHLVLAERKDLAGPAGASLLTTMVLLKPVTQAALAAWFNHSLAQCTAISRSRNERFGIVDTLFETSLHLQEYDQARTDFLAKAIHDFRTPLTAADGYCGLLLAGQLGPLTDVQREVLCRTQNSVKRLSRMTSALGQLTSSVSVQDCPKREGGDIRECIEQARHEIWPRAADRGVKVSINLKQPRCTLLFDREQVSQVLVNLLENACKFTPKHGHIEISGYPYFWERRSMRTASPVGSERRTQNCRSDNSFRIDVSNTGDAITSESMNRFFQDRAFYGSVHRSQGSGLGLAICKRIIKQHCGRIWAEDREEGPKVSFVLPFEPNPHAIVESAGVGDYFMNGNDF